jgi:hypothetical protein
MFVENVEKYWDWMRLLEGNHRFSAETWNDKINQSGREVCWFGHEVSLGFNPRIVNSRPIPQRIREIGEELWGEEFNSILIYKYHSGCELKMHVDRDIFDSRTVMINLCKVGVVFVYNGEYQILKDGEIVWFDNKLPHSICKVPELRYSVQFRKVIV